MTKRVATACAWCIVAICIAGVGVSFVLGVRAHVATGGVLELACAFLMYPIVGAIIIAQRPHNVVGRILVTIGFGTTTTFFSAAYTHSDLGSLGHPLPGVAFVDWLGNVVWPLNLGLGMFLLLLFPTGHLPSPRWRWVAWIGAITLAINAVSSDFMPGPFSGETSINPFGVEALRGILHSANEVSNVLFILIFAAAALSVLWRFWRSRATERQQIKWFVFGVSLLVVCIAVSLLWLPENSNVGFATGFAMLPLTIGIAVLRYHLYDIDFLINRALVYGLLTAALAAIYFGAVIGSQTLTGALTGHSRQQPAVIVLSTLLIAALFQPLRQRLQQTIDRRFYRRKFNTARTLAAFGRTLRTEVEMERLCDHLVSVVEETMQPTHVSLWLRARTQAPLNERGA